jgi:hypothetical protein
MRFSDRHCVILIRLFYGKHRSFRQSQLWRAEGARVIIIIGFLAGPAILLILARALGGQKPVHAIWRWGFRWIYGLFLAVFSLAMIYVGLFESKVDDGRALFVGVIAIAVSGAITLATFKLLTPEQKA